MSAQIIVSDEGDTRRYFWMMPNIVDDLGLSVYAFRLYSHLKRVAGDSGECWQSVETLAEMCKIGSASVVRARKELETAKLIVTRRTANPHGGRPFITIKITDIWLCNFTKYASSKSTSPQEVATSTGELATSPQEVKNNPLKNNSVILTPTIEQQFGSERKPQTPRRPRTVDEIKASVRAAIERGSSRANEISEAVSREFSINPAWNTRRWRSVLEFLISRPEGETVEAFATWWRRDNWKGKKGQPPVAEEIVEQWPQAFQKKPATQEVFSEVW